MVTAVRIKVARNETSPLRSERKSARRFELLDGSRARGIMGGIRRTTALTA